MRNYASNDGSMCQPGAALSQQLSYVTLIIISVYKFCTTPAHLILKFVFILNVQPDTRFQSVSMAYVTTSSIQIQLIASQTRHVYHFTR